MGPNNDDNFIDAMALERWAIPATPREARSPPNTWTGAVPFAYINPPYRPVTASNRNIRLTAPFIDRLLSEMDKGHVKSAIVILPFNPLIRSIRKLLDAGALTCILTERIEFILSLHDAEKAGREDHNRTCRPIFPMGLFYLEKPNHTKANDFVRIFEHYGYIPGVNLASYEGEL